MPRSRSRKLAVALCISAGLHIAMLGGAPVLVPLIFRAVVETGDVLTRLDVRLVSRELPPRREPVPVAAPPRVEAAPLAPPAEPPAVALPTLEAHAIEPVATLSPPVAEAAAVASPAEEVTASEAPAPPVPSMPTHGELTYNVYSGEARWLVGAATHRWEFAPNGAYRLSSETRTTGIFALLRPLHMRDEAVGLLSAGGLQPQHYSTQYNDHAPFLAAFANDGRQIWFRRERERWSILSGGRAFDKLSFFFQMYLTKPTAAYLQTYVVLANRVELYEIRTEREEGVDSVLGPINALHLRRVAMTPDDDRIELWLAVDHDYLPVRMRFYNNRGDHYEQVLTGARYD